MRAHPLLTPTLLFAAALVGASCSGGSDDAGDVDGSGGAASGGVTGVGGGSAAGGTASGDGGGSATGGAPAAAFTCPTVTPGAVPDLTGKNPSEPLTSTPSSASVFLEGPVWADGKLYVSEIVQGGAQPASRILVLNGTTLDEFAPSTGTNGLAFDGTKLWGASHADFGIVTLTLASPTTKTVVVDEFDIDPSSGEPAAGFNSPNDLTLRGDGNVYFTDPTWQCAGNCAQDSTRAYRISPEGVVSVIATTHGQPNGITLSPDGNTLYIAGDGQLEKFPVASDGSVGARGTHGNFFGVDGMAIDCAGNLYLTVNNGITVVKPDGEALATTIAIGAQVTNAAFGGPTNQTLYVTTYGKALYAIELDVPGYPY